MSTASAIRIGHGYDLHRLEPFPPQGRGRPFVLGGLLLDHPLGPVAHSDGDALYHAVTDALLGALSLPDIGQLFPDDDPRHDAQDSAVFLGEAARKVTAAGWVVANLDCTVILERPRLGPLKDRIRENIAKILAVETAAVNLKGKSHEGVDAVGEGRAVEAHAVVLLVKKGAASGSTSGRWR